jgi:NTF2 fold immunity protein
VPDEPAFSDPVQVLTAFISEMNRWELTSWRMSREARGTADPSSYQKPVAEEKARIFTKYCAPKHLKFANIGGFSRPPTYDPQSEQILEVVTEKPGRVSIYTLRTSALRGKRQYVLLKKDGRWWIDNVKGFDHEGKPYKGSL